MKKVILNKCYGGFGISDKAYELYAKKKGIRLYKYKQDFIGSLEKIKIKKVKDNLDEVESVFLLYFTKEFGEEAIISNEDYELYSLYIRDGYREDPVLIEVVEELGKEANSRFSDLVVVEIPDDLDYVIDEYDGIETLHQKVQEW